MLMLFPCRELPSHNLPLVGAACFVTYAAFRLLVVWLELRVQLV
jgi:hypothetical protein